MRIKRVFLQVSYLPLGFLLGMIEQGKRQARRLYLMRRYRSVSWGEGTNADEFCSFGECVWIGSECTTKNASVDSYTYVGCRTEILHARVGKFCSIGCDVRIGLGIHPTRGVVSTYPGFYSSHRMPLNLYEDPSVAEYSITEIGNDVWIGSGAIVLGGVKIGNGAVIGAGAVVTKNVGPYQVFAGNPARFIRNRMEPSQVAEFERCAWWDRPIDQLKQMAPLFMNPDLFLSKYSSNEPK